MSERAMLTTLMAASGSDILGGAGQLEVATVVSPLQLMVDDEVLGMAGKLICGFELDDEQLAWEALTQTEPGQHFLTSPHTLRHCRDGLAPINFVRETRDNWLSSGSKGLLERLIPVHAELMNRDNTAQASPELAAELDGLVARADAELVV
jgi:trimethylamine--corrinoid protein Co-methyltransferase